MAVPDRLGRQGRPGRKKMSSCQQVERLRPVAGSQKKQVWRYLTGNSPNLGRILLSNLQIPVLNQGGVMRL
jgi:hypothetical protein